MLGRGARGRWRTWPPMGAVSPVGCEDGVALFSEFVRQHVLIFFIMIFLVNV